MNIDIHLDITPGFGLLCHTWKCMDVTAWLEISMQLWCLYVAEDNIFLI